MIRAEKLIYPSLIDQALRKLYTYNVSIPRTDVPRRQVFDDFVLLKWPNGLKYLMKLCPSYWETNRIDLTSPELNLLSECAGIIFMMGKKKPDKEMNCEYEYVVCSSDFICGEADNYPKRVISACFFKFRYEFYPSRILTYGTII